MKKKKIALSCIGPQFISQCLLLRHYMSEKIWIKNKIHFVIY